VILAVKDLWAVGLAAVVLLGFFAFFSSPAWASPCASAFDQAALAAASVCAGCSRGRGESPAVSLLLPEVQLGSGPAAVTPSLGLIALAAFPAMILGGLDSPKGAVLGGLLIGVIQTLTAGYQPQYAAFLGNNFYSVMPYVVMIGILLIRPYGLFGTKEVHRL
jgi:branched-chain amino acid transport system permease protein